MAGQIENPALRESTELSALSECTQNNRRLVNGSPERATFPKSIHKSLAPVMENSQTRFAGLPTNKTFSAGKTALQNLQMGARSFRNLAVCACRTALPGLDCSPDGLVRHEEGTNCLPDGLPITSWHFYWAARICKLEPGAHPALLPFAHLYSRS